MRLFTISVNNAVLDSFTKLLWQSDAGFYLPFAIMHLGCVLAWLLVQQGQNIITLKAFCPQG